MVQESDIYPLPGNPAWAPALGPVIRADGFGGVKSKKCDRLDEQDAGRSRGDWCMGVDLAEAGTGVCAVPVAGVVWKCVLVLQGLA